MYGPAVEISIHRPGLSFVFKNLTVHLTGSLLKNLILAL
jgi:hypothetical protein